MEPDIEQRLQRLDDGQKEILRRLDAMNGDMRETAIEIGGVPGVGRAPNRRSLRVRLHDLENDRTTAHVAATTLATAKELRAAAGDKRFTRREKTIALLLAAVVALGPYVAPFLH